ncbi:MAG: B12-binding domain-containing radical SAM protein [Candidatus Scalindua sp.]|jgi:anaerobic magnesium-protoporphyrin IX monomethyl ester cyclase|nr:B12-binding domain-containing radical SAM protein [Candidatus Scalindua sp.]MBT6227822.1 B12-binding domain-containing radical SAM protein [Candidatus Scalindua sp.]
MLDMILINPKSQALGIFDFLVAKSIPLGLGYVAAYLLEKNYTVKIIDEEVGRLDKEKIRALTDNENQLFGISSMTPTISRAYELADLIKSVFPKSTVVFGGIHPTVMPEEVLSRESVDLVVSGEAEPIIEEIVVSHHSGKGFKDILSCSYNDNGKIIHNPRAPLIDINNLPDVPYSLFDSTVYDMGFVISSRGCPYNCVFCSQRAINGNQYRYRSCDKVVNEIKNLIKHYAPSNIVFFDDIFTINKKRIHELCDLMVENDLHRKAEYTMVTRADCLDDDILQRLRSTNFTGLAIGVETASEEIMRMIDKKETVKDMIDGIELAHKYNFDVDTVYIFGLPGETRQDRVDTLNMAISLNVSKARFNNATPYPGTRLFDMAKEEKNLKVIGDWENFHPTGALTSSNSFEWPIPYYPKGTTKEELIMDVIQANMLYYLQPKRMWKLVKASINRKGTKWLVLPPKWWMNIHYIKGIFKVLLLNMKRFMWLIKWKFQGKLLTQYKEKRP